MMLLFDIYVLSSVRRRETVDAFLAKYCNSILEAAAEYPFPQFSDQPSIVYHDVDSLIQAVLIDSNVPYSLYFNAQRPEDPIRSSMLFFTTDGCLVAGMTVACGQDELERYLQSIAKCVEGNWGYATVETPPPLSEVEFIAEAGRSLFSLSCSSSTA